MLVGIPTEAESAKLALPTRMLTGQEASSAAAAAGGWRAPGMGTAAGGRARLPPPSVLLLCGCMGRSPAPRAQRR